METVLPLRTAWIADILSQASLRDVQRQRCWKRGSGDGYRDGGTTTRLSDLSMPFRLCASPLKGEVRRSTWTVCTAADCEERQICTMCLFAESIGLWKVDGLVCMLSAIVEHTFVWEGIGGSGEEGRFDVATRSQTPKPPAKTANSNSCDRAAAQVKEHKPEQPGWKYSKYWANIEKRNQINTKNYWK